jgi:hypothetical protein
VHPRLHSDSINESGSAGHSHFPPAPLFLLTLAGILISSTSIYYFRILPR